MDTTTLTCGCTVHSAENGRKALVTICTGIGTLLWQDCLATAARIGLSRIRIESDPFAEGFYTGMGATRVGDVQSQSIPDRRLPLLSFDILRRR